VASVLGTFGLTNRQLDGDHKLPEALTVFGSLKVSSISIFHGDEDEGSSYTVQPVGAKLAEVAKAAGLKKDGPRYAQGQGGIVEASEPQPGTVQLACIGRAPWPPHQARHRRAGGRIARAGCQRRRVPDQRQLVLVHVLDGRQQCQLRRVVGDGRRGRRDDQKMQDDLKNCDDVGIGASIKTAIGAHSEMASATPNVESLFDVNDCFASVSQIIDLSFSIPSLGSILSSAQDAV
jgi:hypothetical protein